MNNMKITLIISVSIITCCNEITNSEKEFFKYFENENIIELEVDNLFEFNRESIKLITHGETERILVIDEQDKIVYNFNVSTKQKMRFDLDYFDPIENDVSTDKNGKLYLLNNVIGEVKIFDHNGQSINKLKVRKGEKICSIENEEFLIYQTRFLPNTDEWNDSIISVYDSNGSVLNSWGQLKIDPCVDLLPISGGEINLSLGFVLYSHFSDYSIHKYSLKGEFLNSYDMVPNFYYKLKQFKGLNKTDLEEWYKTTLNIYSNLLNEEYVISYYSQVDNSKNWLFFQNKTNSVEVVIPENIEFIGILGGNVIINKIENEKQNDNLKQITLYSYELKQEIFN